GLVLHPRHVVRVRAVEVATRPLLLVELDQDPLVECLLGEAGLLLLAAVAPDDPVRLAELGRLLDPLQEMRVLRHRRLGDGDRLGRSHRWIPTSRCYWSGNAGRTA